MNKPEELTVFFFYLRKWKKEDKCIAETAQRLAYSVHKSNGDARQSHSIYRPCQKAVAAWSRQDRIARTHSLNSWLSIQIQLGFFLSHVAQTWTPASNRKKDESTAVQTSKKRIPKQLTQSGGRSSVTKRKNNKRTHASIKIHRQTSARPSASMRKTNRT